MSDPISDFLTRIRNGIMANKKWVDVPSSIIKKRISFVLKEESYIEDFIFISKGNNKSLIRIFLKYDFQGLSVIENIKRISKPGNRVYVSQGRVPRVLDGLGISILSTSKGVLSHKKANTLGVGGEIICEVY
ncbi:MAG: 30S ribosomal protein S8 [Candidatus Neomarinimicrobiota bacterium]